MVATTVQHGCDQSGATAARPSNAPDGFCFFDLTLNIAVFRDNVNEKWLDALGRDITAGILDMAGDGSPTDGTSGTGAGVAAPGCRYTDYTNAIDYINTNTKASPTWTISGTQEST
ncbi:MAG: hypothetical protein U9Q07_06200 [Planctomycetota bacterium]|nr:hypothetical protein [Planctomycetota bacterium]